ncbi:endonuclease III [Pyrofollis japonicus]|uniref:endonuclease III domain-containing protein n=1 Tax=Pyrofollis japonicus TaxID=3060460 RepID=UPI00295A8497|nr:hypothetical protein [Pyrofollis japonicus]BEP16749.1 endonuclease III [Pyrofollis japonicus]
MSDPRSLVEELVKRLREWFREEPWWRGKSPYEVLLRILLGARVTYRQVSRVIAEIMERYPRPEMLADASLEELRRLVKSLGLVEQRAKLLRGLGEVMKQVGGLEEFLRLSPEEARRLLLSVPGVGEKAADLVLAALFGQRLFVVDTHILRIAKRLGLLDESISNIYEARRRLEPLIPPEHREWLHVALLRLGREVCRPRRPRCEECPLRDICKHARQRVEK